jgi:hypothetical protein
MSKDILFEIKYNCREGDVTITFYEQRFGVAYKIRSPRCQLISGEMDWQIKLPVLNELEYIRSSHDHARSLVFVFSNKEAAKRWAEGLPLVVRGSKEVRLKGKWKEGDLKKALGMQEEVSENVEFLRAATSSRPPRAAGTLNRLLPSWET